MAPRTCCFWFNLRTGTLAAAIYTLICKILAIISFSLILAVLVNEPEKQQSWQQLNATKSEIETLEERHELLQFLYSRFLPPLFLCIVSGSFNILLIIGVKKSKPWMFWPWLTCNTLEIVAAIIGGIVLVAILPVAAGVTAFLIDLALIVFQSYLLYCVLCYYRQIATKTQGMQISVPYERADEEHPTGESKMGEQFI